MLLLESLELKLEYESKSKVTGLIFASKSVKGRGEGVME